MRSFEEQLILQSMMYRAQYVEPHQQNDKATIVVHHHSTKLNENKRCGARAGVETSTSTRLVKYLNMYISTVGTGKTPTIGT